MKRLGIYILFLGIIIPVNLIFSTEKRIAKKQEGVIVEETGKNSSEEKPGLKVGDTLISWERFANPPSNPNPASGFFYTPFDVKEVEVEEASRGGLKIVGKRDDKFFTQIILPNEWKFDARPVNLPGDILSLYHDGKKLLDSDENSEEHKKSISILDQALDRAKILRDCKIYCWLCYRIGNLLVEKRQFDSAIKFYDKGIEILQKKNEQKILSQFYLAIGKAFEKQSRFKEAVESYNKTLKIREGMSTESLWIAQIFNNIGLINSNLGDLDSAEKYHLKSIAIRERAAPDSLEVGMSLNNLGIVAWYRGDLAAAEDYYRKSLVVFEKLSPESLGIATILNNTGVVIWNRGDFNEAEKFHLKALAIREKLLPGSLEVAGSLNNLGLVAYVRGNLSLAEEYYRKSLSIYERLDPESLVYATIENNLGIVVSDQGDLYFAEELYKKSLAIREKISPDSLDVAMSLFNLGTLAKEQDDITLAENFYKKALDIRQKISPNSLDVAMNLNNLGNMAYYKSDFPLAEDYYRKSVTICENLAPKGLQIATSLKNLGVLLRNKGDLPKAESFFKKSLEIVIRLAPGSSGEAELWHELGSLYKQRKELNTALDSFQNAVNALESQKCKIGGGREAEERFSANYADYYRDLIELEVKLKKKESALNTIERFRARALLNMLAERDLMFTKDAPADLLTEQKGINYQYDKVQEELSGLSSERDSGKIDELLNKLHELRNSQNEIEDRIKKSSPKLASLQYPEPLDVEGIKKVLDPNVLLLAYNVGENETELLALLNCASNNDFKLEAYIIPVKRKDLQRMIISYRILITDRNSNITELSRIGINLYELLVKPAERLIKQSGVILISPDSFLHYLPFASLKINKRKYLIEEKPIFEVISSTILSELRRQPGSAKNTLLYAFGDPKYPNQIDKRYKDAGVVYMTKGKPITSLPSTREEVEEIGSLYKQDARLFIGGEASEVEAKSVSKDVRYLHFACHGLLDERFPLNSALVLTIPEKAEEGSENGFLQAWEIFEGLRIDADLVTLSACETGLGKEMGGEGLIGLTRAFQYAGARTVLSSLWNVSDESTAFLMKQFYYYLKEGKTKAESLRLAQMSFLERHESMHRPSPVSGYGVNHSRELLDSHVNGNGNKENWSHPFYWAPFILNGDWK